MSLFRAASSIGVADHTRTTFGVVHGVLRHVGVKVRAKR